MQEGDAGSAAGNITGAQTEPEKMSDKVRACREQTWAEMSPERKMEKMREEIQWQRRIIKDLCEAADVARTHIHAPDGKVMVPAVDYRNESEYMRNYVPLK